MRSDSSNLAGLRRWAPLVLVGVLLSWLVIQNGALLLLVSWPAMPTVTAVMRALLKVGAIMAVQLAPGTLIAGGSALLWLAARRSTPASSTRLQGVHHG